MKDCCQADENKDEECIRSSDGKIFKTNRRFSKDQCLKGPIKGFTMRASCAPWNTCSLKKSKPQKQIEPKKEKQAKNETSNLRSKKKKKHKSGGMSSSKSQNLLQKDLETCSLHPLTGFDRSGKCLADQFDQGNHLVCAQMTPQFLEYTANQGNDLSSVVKDGEKWCLCQNRWEQAYQAKKDPPVILSASNQLIHPEIKQHILAQNKPKASTLKKEKNNKQKTTKTFLYNKDDPKSSRDIYSNDHPEDTIPVKYATLEELKNTIQQLEQLYQQQKYDHKRISQVALIIKVRLKIIMDQMTSKNKSKKKIAIQRYQLALKYLNFLKDRTKLKSLIDRKKLTFTIP